MSYIRIAFGASGDRESIPQEGAADGPVSFEQGYGIDYSLPRGSDPDALTIERTKFNELMYIISSAVQQYQQFGVPEWIDASENDGVDFPYEENAMVKYTDGDVYMSLVGSNTALPTDTDFWVKISGNLGYLSDDQTWAGVNTFSEEIVGDISGTAGSAAEIDTAAETSDTTCFPLFITDNAGGNAAAKFNSSYTFNSSTGLLSVLSYAAGANGGTGGKLTLYGSTSGSVEVRTAAAAGTGTVFQYPSDNGTNGYVLQTNGAGVTSWASAPTPTNISTANEATDTTCFPVFVTASGTQSLPAKTNTGFGFNSNTGALSVPSLTLTGTPLPVGSGGTGLATLTANNVILGNGASAPSFVAPSTSGNVLTSNGTTWVSSAPASGGAINTQTFNASGTWTKPGSGTWAFVQVWGGGGSGGSGSNTTLKGAGGGGGGYNAAWVPLASLGSTETVTVGAG
jgi:hypothetical protein